MTSVWPLLLVHHDHEYIGGTKSAAAGCGRFAAYGLGGDIAKENDHLHARFLEPAVDFTFEAADLGFDTFEDSNLLQGISPDS